MVEGSGTHFQPLSLFHHPRRDRRRPARRARVQNERYGACKLMWRMLILGFDPRNLSLLTAC